MKNPFANRTTEDRVSRAQESTNRIVEHVDHLVRLHEANRIILYQDTLSRQIGRSRATRAFNLLQDSLYKFEIIRLCAVWEKAGVGRDSIPTIINLVDDRKVRKVLATNEFDRWRRISPRILDPSDDPVEHATKEKLIASNFECQVKKRARTSIRELCRVIRKAKEIPDNDAFEALRAHRNQYHVHTLMPEAVSD